VGSTGGPAHAVVARSTNAREVAVSFFDIVT
jgi:hypothetical protein